MTSNLDLMCAHIDALFTQDDEGQLLCVNEPNGAPAPRFFLGRTVDGDVLRFRRDVDHDARRELEAAAQDGFQKQGLDSPIGSSRYEEILARIAPVQRTWVGPAFSFPRELPATNGAILVSDANAEVLRPHLEPWVPDVRLCPPMAALTVDGYAVSVCASVRRTAVAHEAGVETAVAFRGRGYAAHVVAEWANAVREMDRIPLYSTSWQNGASRAVARKLGLVLFGSDLHIT